MATVAQQTTSVASTQRRDPAAGAVFIETLRRDWRQPLYWGGGLALMGLMLMLTATQTDFLEEYRGLTEAFPQLLEAFVGADASFLATVEGYLSIEYFSWITLLYALVAVLFGVNVIANEEALGSIEILLTQPLPRWRMVLEKSAAYTLLVVAIGLIAYAGLLLGDLSAQVLTVDAWLFFVAATAVIPFTLMMMGITILLSAILRRRALVGQISALIVAAGFVASLLNNLASDVALVQAVASLSPFTYYDPAAIMQQGVTWGALAVMFGVFIVCVAAAAALFQRRDVA